MYRSTSAAAAVLAAALTAAVTISGAPEAEAAAGCRVDYQVTNEWQGGFIASLNVTNLGDAVTGWRLTWSYGAGQTVSQIWNGTVRQSGAQVTVDNVNHNASLGTGASAGIGFVANGPTTPVPSDFALNGTTCTGSAPAPDVLAKAHTAGRVTNSGQYSWPGVYFAGRFRGTGVGIVLNDSTNDYDVQIDGATVTTLSKPGRTTHWVNNLSNADHTVRLVKRTESPWVAAAEFGGFVAASGGTILAKPVARTRQIEFIGDSLTAGYGNLSTTRDCSANGGVDRNTNTDLSFGARTARALNADYQINAFSGRGMVRNYGGGQAGTSYRTYYDRALLNVDGDVWQNPGTWRPQLVVVGLGTNDFSTALNPGEQWPDQQSLVAAYKSAYQGFLDKLRSRYGSGTTILVSVPEGSGTFADAVRQVAQDRANQGDSRVRYWNYADPAIDRLGCDWHFSQRDHQLISGLLGNYISGLNLAW